MTVKRWAVAGIGALAASVLAAAWLLQSPPAPRAAEPERPRALGGPVLLVSDANASVNFGAYFAEILRAEGWTAFSELDVRDVTAEALKGARAVIVSWVSPLAPPAAAVLDGFARSGGAVIVMGPRADLQPLTGVTPQDEQARFIVTPARFTEVEGDVPVDAGAPDVTLQVHGTAVSLSPGPDVDVIARYTPRPGAPASDIAIARRRLGSGWVASWGFDPARTVAYIRQGDPSWHGEERDGQPGPRATDAFVGWNELTLMIRPQADAHMRLLTSVLESLLDEHGGLPRLWYFPAARPALLVATADAHASTVDSLESALGIVERAGGHLSVYYEPQPPASRMRGRVRRGWRWLRSWWSPPALPTPALVNGWGARGHEFAVHPVVDRDDLGAAYRESMSLFADQGFGTQPTTVRTHAVLWRGWVESAKVEERLGYRMTLDYYQSGPWLRQRDGSWMHDAFTGTGLALRLVDDGGHLLGLRQLTTTLVDEHLIAGTYGGWEGLDADGATDVSRAVLERAVRVHGAPALQFHVDFLEPSHPLRPIVSRWIANVLSVARRLAMPVWSAAQLADFERCREETRAGAVAWPEAGVVRFRVQFPASGGCRGATMILPRGPTRPVDGAITVTIDGVPRPDSLAPLGDRQLLVLPDGAREIEVRYGVESRQ